MSTFWHLINHLSHMQCTASNRGHVIYGGNCVQAWLLALHLPGTTWSIGGLPVFGA